jgi:prolipoprotein diacylglyceryltransferase
MFNIYGAFHSIGIILWYNYFLNTFSNEFSQEFMQDSFEYFFVGGIFVAYIGARLMCFFGSDMPFKKIHQIHKGGLSIYGSLYSSSLYIIYMSYIFNYDTIKMLEAIGISSCYLIITGRLANYAIGELNGIYSTILKCQHPNQLYECIGEGIITLYITSKYKDTIGQGYIMFLYPFTYSFFRIWCEFYRIDDIMPKWYKPIRQTTGIKWDQMQAILICIYFPGIYFLY